MANLPIKDPPEFTLDVLQWDRETMADGAELSKVPEVLLNNDIYLKGQVEQIKAMRAATLTAAGWSSSAPYMQTVTTAGIFISDTPIVSLYVPSGLSAEAVKAQKKAYGMVDRAETAEGQITFVCYNKKPAADFQVAVKGV